MTTSTIASPAATVSQISRRSKRSSANRTGPTSPNNGLQATLEPPNCSRSNQPPQPMYNNLRFYTPPCITPLADSLYFFLPTTSPTSVKDLIEEDGGMMRGSAASTGKHVLIIIGETVRAPLVPCGCHHQKRKWVSQSCLGPVLNPLFVRSCRSGHPRLPMCIPCNGPGMVCSLPPPLPLPFRLGGRQSRISAQTLDPPPRTPPPHN